MAMAVAAIHTKLGLRSLEARPKLWASAQHLEPFAFQEAVHIIHINIQIYTLHTHTHIYIYTSIIIYSFFLPLIATVYPNSRMFTFIFILYLYSVWP